MRGWRVLLSAALATTLFSAVVWNMGARPAAVETAAPKANAPTVVHQAIYPSAPFFDNAYRAAGPAWLTSAEAARVTALVTPHHLVVRSWIAKMFKSLEGTSYETVVIVSPDHFELGRGRATVSTATWRTPYGDLPSDDGATPALVRAGATLDERPFQSEHGITGLVAFVRKSLPDAHVATLVLRPDVGEQQVDSLAAALAGLTARQRVLVVASVDFTHEADATVADVHDAATVAALQAFDYAGIAVSNVDSPATLRLMTRFAELTGAKEFRQLSATYSERLMGHPDRLGTSHVIGAFLRP